MKEKVGVGGGGGGGRDARRVRLREAHVRDEVHEGVADERADGERDERLLEVVVEAHAREPLDREHREQAAHADHNDGRRAEEQRAKNFHPKILSLVLVVVVIALMRDLVVLRAAVNTKLEFHYNFIFEITLNIFCLKFYLF